jgi:hypothetical protein
MSAISDNLIHFLARGDKEAPNKQFEIFKLIIRNGLRTGKVLIKFSEGASIINQIICFTDIPLRECSEHTGIYGKFGIGFKKSYVKNAGGNPARYFLDYMPGQTDAKVETRGLLYLLLCQQYNFLAKLHALRDACVSKGMDLNNPNPQPQFDLCDAQGNSVFTAREWNTQCTWMITGFSFDKQMGDLGPARDETQEIDLYYKEREWRLVPSELSLVSGAAKREEAGDHFLYPFERSDVNMVVVPNEEIRSDVLEYFIGLRQSDDERLRRFGENPLPVINYDDMNRW